MPYCFFVDFVAAPLACVLDRTGHLDRLLWKWSARRERRAISQNPFRGYNPGKQDVFVMTYAKSGTNWVLQTVWQLTHHCQRDFDHIHSVVPRPDAVLNTSTMRNYAVPLEKSDDWQTAPERKRIIKTHLNWELVPYSIRSCSTRVSFERNGSNGFPLPTFPSRLSGNLNDGVVETLTICEDRSSEVTCHRVRPRHHNRS
jgi:hypothetical protein